MRVAVSFNVSDEERQWIAFSKDFKYDEPPPMLRKATRAEVVDYYRSAAYTGMSEDRACELGYHRVIGVECANCDEPHE